jgi:hypothetical protein
MYKSKTKTKTKDLAPPVEVEVAVPSLHEHLQQLAVASTDVLSGKLPLDRGRLWLGMKKQEMKPYDWMIQAARMNPAMRPAVAKLLGLPEPKPAVAI